MGDVWGDYPTWILALATPISIIIGFLIARQQLQQNVTQQNQTLKIEEQKFFFEVNKMLSSEISTMIRNEMYAEIYDKKKIDFTRDGFTKMLDIYLNNLEFICNLYEKGLVSITMIDDFAGMDVSNVMTCESIKQYIFSERNRVDKRLWVIIQQVYNVLHPESQIEFPSEKIVSIKNGITTYADGKRVDSHGTIL